MEDFPLIGNDLFNNQFEDSMLKEAKRLKTEDRIVLGHRPGYSSRKTNSNRRGYCNFRHTCTCSRVSFQQFQPNQSRVHQPSPTQCFCSAKTFSHGNLSSCSPDTQPWLVGHLHGPERCLTPYSSSQRSPEISTIYMYMYMYLSRHYVPISVPSIRPVHSSSSLHQSNQGGRSSLTMPAGPSLPLPGRLADTYSPFHPGSSHKDYPAYLRPRIYYQHREVLPDTYMYMYPNTYFPWSLPQYHYGQSLTYPRKMYNSGGMCSSLLLLSQPEVGFVCSFHFISFIDFTGRKT